MAINRASPISKLASKLHQLQEAHKTASERTAYREGVPCVFISHKQEDTEACESIAEYLLDADIDIYLDKYDESLQAIAASGNPDRLTNRITEGIEKSTHMLCVVSPRTVDSYWVPFEVGYGYEQIDLGILTLKGIQDEDLPDYMRTTEVVRGIRSMNNLIAQLLGESKSHLENRGVLIKESKRRHPLDNVLDWNK